MVLVMASLPANNVSSLTFRLQQKPKLQYEFGYVCDACLYRHLYEFEGLVLFASIDYTHALTLERSEPKGQMLFCLGNLVGNNP